MTNQRETGAVYEQKAAAFLQSKGYEVLELNFRCRSGEIDIVAKDGEYLVFVEVKYRANNKKGHPFEAVSLQKQGTICKCAMFYITKHGVSYLPVRFDVVGITGEEIHLLQNAFDFIG